MSSIAPVPFVDLTRIATRVKGPVIDAWSRCLDSADYIGGKAIEQFEKLLAERCGVAHAVSCANGTDAMILALQAAGVRAGDLVALPNVTFWATFEAVVNIGAKPVLIDIEPEDLHMSLSEFSAAFEKFRFAHAILPHLFGWASSRLCEFRSYCTERGIFLLEDGAQAFGVERTESGGRNVSIFSGARAASLSFYPTKVLGGCMDGGAICFADRDLAEKCRVLANHGRSGRYTHSESGWNSRMSSLQAEWLLRVVPLVSEMIALRNQGLEFYRTFFNSVGKGVAVHATPFGILGNAYLAVLTIAQRNASEICSALNNAGIGAARIYPETIDMQPPARDAARISSLHHGRAFCRSVINLPLFPWMTNDELSRSANALASIL